MIEILLLVAGILGWVVAVSAWRIRRKPKGNHVDAFNDMLARRVKQAEDKT